MSWVRRGRQIGVALKNVSRLKEIVRVFAKHGFTDILVRARLDRFLPGKMQRFLNEQAEIPSAQRLRESFEELGPTFIKLGQVLACRPDLLPESIVDELKLLQDSVKPLPYSEILRVLEHELKGPTDHFFSFVDPEPLAAASIAQVHRATLKTGESVVLKVQKPGIAQIVEQDLALLDFIAGLLEKYIPETRLISPSMIVDEFFRSLKQELDFYLEANHILRYTEMMVEFPEIKVPIVHKPLSTQRLLVMEELRGIPMRDIERIKNSKADLKRINEVGARAFFKSIMKDGFFHGDLHGGNVLLLEDGRLGLLDFGLMGRISRRSRQQLSNMVLALLQEDFEALCYLYADLGAANPSVDFDGFQREIRSSLAPYLGLKASEINSGQVLMESTKIAARYQIRMPADWMLVFKAIMTAEGLGRSLDPNFDMMELGRELAQDLFKQTMSLEYLSKDLFWAGKDLIQLAQVLPRQVRWLFRKWNQDGFVFEWKSKQLDDIRLAMTTSSKRQSRATLGAGLFIASAIGLSHPDAYQLMGYPVFSGLCFLMGLWMWWRT